MDEENDVTMDKIIDLCGRCKSVEIRRHVYMDGATEKVEYVAIGRIDRGMSRATGTTLEKAIANLDAKAD